MHEHLIFFDNQCFFCNKSVRNILEIDLDGRFLFAPMNGKTADEILIGPQAKLKKANSLILVENYQSTTRKFWVRSKAILRTYWLNKNGWTLIGILSFLPNFIYEPFYIKFGEHRHQYKLSIPEDVVPEGKILP